MGVRAIHQAIGFLVIFIALQKTNGIELIDIVRNINSALAYPEIEFSENPPFRKEYDFIIIGCGASGALLANRLTEIPEFQVICIEAGEKEDSRAEIPRFTRTLEKTDYNWKFSTAYNEDLCQGFEAEVCRWPSGRAVGGTTVINTMVYNRGNRKDYDEWAQMGNYGWSFEEVLPYFMKFENFRKLNLNDTTDHGLHGELDIEYGAYESPLRKYILKSANELGIPEIDVNGENQIGISPLNFMLRNGRRLSAARAFLFPIKDRPNLHILEHAVVTKILIDRRTNAATGVEISFANKTHTIKAKKEVILSAGGIKSPQVLMLSGIGPRKHLQDLKIEVIKDLPVGKHLKDHVKFFGIIFLAEKPIKAEFSHPFLNFLLFGKGPYTLPGNQELYSFINVGSDTLPPDVPNMELGFSGPLSAEDIKKLGTVYELKEEYYQEVYGGIDGRDGFSFMPILLKPKSYGTVELNSADPFEMPNISPNYFSDERDIEVMIGGIRQGIKIGLGRPLQQKFKVQLHKFNVEPCSEFEFDTYAFWKCILKLFPGSVYHPVSTCKMGPKGDKGRIVDPELRVQGIKRLRVVDASVMPQMPAGHLTSTCYMIAEKAADMIKQTHGALK